MAEINIWYRYKDRPAEKIDTASNQQEANYLMQEYRLAYGNDLRAGNAKLWAGRKKDEPGKSDND